MKVHRVVLCIVDHDEVGEDEIRTILEDGRYPNRCMSPTVEEFESREIEWHDQHPLNLTDSCAAEFKKLFAEKPVPRAAP